MFERLTEQAVQVITTARDEARRLRHDSIGLEHLFVAFSADTTGIVGQALQEAGVKVENVRVALGHTTKRVRAKPVMAIPMDEATRKVVEGSVDQASKFDDSRVGPQHLMLSLLDANDEVITKMCHILEIEPAWLRSRCIYLAIEHVTPALSVRQRLVGGLRNRDNPYSEQGLLTLKIAQDRARLAGNKFAGTEQLLLGIVCGDSYVARTLLWQKGVNLTLVSAQIRLLVGQGAQQLIETVTFTPMAARALTQAQFEAARRKQETEVKHILFGLIEEERSLATQILRNLSIDPAALRREVVELLDDASR